MNKKFDPTPDQIETARELCMAMAFQQTTAPIYRSFEKQILENETFHYDIDANTRMVDQLTDDGLIRDPDDICLMAGVSQLGTPEGIGTDADRFFKKLHEECIKYGYVDGVDVLAKADNEIVRLQWKLIELTAPIHELSTNLFTKSAQVNRIIDILLSMFAPYLRGADYEKKTREYFCARIKG
jgi:hypothetical protein